MRIASGSSDRKIAFVAVDSTDLKTRETGLSSFTVYRSRNGGTATAYTTPTVTELSAGNMPGVYVLTVDEDTTLDSGHDEEEYVVHITQASMAPVTRAVTLYRPKFTEGQSATMANSAVDADLERIAGSVVSTTTAQLGVNAVQVSGDGTAADTLELFAEALDQATGQLDSGSLASGTITAAAIAADAITAAKVAADVSAEIADAVLDEDMTAHQTQGTLGQAIGDPAADTNTIFKAVVTDATGATVGVDVAAVLVDTAEIGAAGAGLTALATQASVDTIDTNVDAILVDTGTTLQGELDGIQADTEDIQARLPAALVSGRIDASVGAMAANVLTAAAAASDLTTELRSIVSGTADSGTTTTMVDAARTEADTDYWKDMAILFTSGTISGQARLITAFNPATDTITFSPATTQAVGTNTYEIIPNVAAAGASAPTAAEVADAVWDEAQSGHVGAGTFGEIATEIADILVDTGTTLQGEVDGIQADTEDIQSRLPAALVSGRIDASVGAMAANVLTASALATDAVNEIVDQTWDEATADHSTAGTTGKALTDAGSAGDPWSTALPGAYGAGTAGKIVGDNLNATVSSRATQASVDTIDGIVDSILADTGTDGVPLTAAAVDAILDEVVEGSTTLRQSIRLANSANGGKLSGADTLAPKIRDLADSKNRVDAVTDANGNRTSVTLDLT